MSTFTKNKKAYHDYEILETFECGIVLSGDEVKSIRNNQANMAGAFIDVDPAGEAYVNEMHIGQYSHSSNKSYDVVRKRKLILHKKEIEKIDESVSQKGVTTIPLELYAKKGLIKLKIGICRGKKLYDKRETLKKKSQQIEINRQLKRYE